MLIMETRPKRDRLILRGPRSRLLSLFIGRRSRKRRCETRLKQPRFQAASDRVFVFRSYIGIQIALLRMHSSRFGCFLTVEVPQCIAYIAVREGEAKAPLKLQTQHQARDQTEDPYQSSSSAC